LTYFDWCSRISSMVVCTLFLQKLITCSITMANACMALVTRIQKSSTIYILHISRSIWERILSHHRLEQLKNVIFDLKVVEPFIFKSKHFGALRALSTIFRSKKFAIHITIKKSKIQKFDLSLLTDPLSSKVSILGLWNHRQTISRPISV
jgi:hypothetical protein